MKNIKKMGFAMLLGLFAFGFSAFKSKQPKTVYFYYKVDLTYPIANDPRGYKYYDDDRCELGGALCGARWDIGTRPTPTNGDSLPLSGITFQTDTPGHFE